MIDTQKDKKWKCLSLNIYRQQCEHFIIKMPSTTVLEIVKDKSPQLSVVFFLNSVVFFVLWDPGPLIEKHPL